MLPLLFWVPTGTSLIFGLVFLAAPEAKRGTKILGLVVFVVAVYLQFFSSYALAGLLLQVALALVLVLWRRIDAAG